MSKIGLALAGGGLQGFAHIGAIKALEELGVHPDYISGTSTGSIMACFYAAGFSADEVEKICSENYKNLIRFRKRRIAKAGANFAIHKETRLSGLIDGRVIENFVNKYASIKKIENIKDIKSKKLAIATVDTISMKECIFVKGNVKNKDKNINYIEDINIGLAIRASMAFPGIFTLPSYQEYNFMDGGTVDNLPVQVLKDMGAEKVISIAFDLSHYEPSKNIEDIVLRALDIFSLEDVRRAQEISDVSVEIYNKDAALITIDNIETAVENGYQAVMQKKEEILKMI